MKVVVLAAAAFSLAACASIPQARMLLPDQLSGHAEAVTVTGIGGGRSGSFRAGAFSGSFTRSASRLAFFDPLYERRDGHTTFSVIGPEINGRIDAACNMRERSITLSVISFQPHPMAYGCSFMSQGLPLPARFEVQAHRQGMGGMMMREERRGQIAIDGTVVQIRSVHDLQGSPIQIGTPIGYVFERDGAAVGAVEINGAPVITYASGMDAQTRRAILMAALALGLFWDPAESALGREAG
jgi:hypothetical protein